MWLGRHKERARRRHDEEGHGQNEDWNAALGVGEPPLCDGSVPIMSGRGGSQQDVEEGP